jgi:hypothetical protein
MTETLNTETGYSKSFIYEQIINAWNAGILAGRHRAPRAPDGLHSLTLASETLSLCSWGYQPALEVMILFDPHPQDLGQRMLLAFQLGVGVLVSKALEGAGLRNQSKTEEYISAAYEGVHALTTARLNRPFPPPAAHAQKELQMMRTDLLKWYGGRLLRADSYAFVGTGNDLALGKPTTC